MSSKPTVNGRVSVQFVLVLVILGEGGVLIRLLQHRIADNEHVHVGSHEAAEGILGRAEQEPFVAPALGSLSNSKEGTVDSKTETSGQSELLYRILSSGTDASDAAITG